MGRATNTVANITFVFNQPPVYRASKKTEGILQILEARLEYREREGGKLSNALKALRASKASKASEASKASSVGF